MSRSRQGGRPGPSGAAPGARLLQVPVPVAAQPDLHDGRRLAALGARRCGGRAAGRGRGGARIGGPRRAPDHRQQLRVGAPLQRGDLACAAHGPLSTCFNLVWQTEGIPEGSAPALPHVRPTCLSGRLRAQHGDGQGPMSAAPQTPLRAKGSSLTTTGRATGAARPHPARGGRSRRAAGRSARTAARARWARRVRVRRRPPQGARRRPPPPPRLPRAGPAWRGRSRAGTCRRPVGWRPLHLPLRMWLLRVQRPRPPQRRERPPPTRRSPRRRRQGVRRRSVQPPQGRRACRRQRRGRPRLRPRWRRAARPRRTDAARWAARRAGRAARARPRPRRAGRRPRGPTRARRAARLRPPRHRAQAGGGALAARACSLAVLL